jgi:hypothetical protein
MCFVISLFPATVWMVIGFAVLYLTAKATGNLQKFGKILAIWIFVLSLVLPICGAYLTISGKCPLTRVFQHTECSRERDECRSPKPECPECQQPTQK